jgi:hypothetical protein
MQKTATPRPLQSDNSWPWKKRQQIPPQMNAPAFRSMIVQWSFHVREIRGYNRFIEPGRDRPDHAPRASIQPVALDSRLGGMAGREQ